MKLRIKVGDEVVVANDPGLFRPGQKGRVIAIRKGKMQPIVTVEWPDLHLHSNYLAKYLQVAITRL